VERKGGGQKREHEWGWKETQARSGIIVTSWNSKSFTGIDLSHNTGEWGKGSNGSAYRKRVRMLRLADAVQP